MMNGLGEVDPNAPVDEAGMSEFRVKWEAVKIYFVDFESQVGQKIIDKLNKMEQMRTALLAAGNVNVGAALDQDIAKVRADLDSYWECKEIKDEYYDMWVSVAGSVGLAGVRGLGAWPVLYTLYLSIAGLVALVAIVDPVAYLYTTYKTQTYVLDQLSSPNLSQEARDSLEEVARQTEDEGILDTIGDSVISGVQIAILIGVGLIGYKAYQSV